MEWFGDMESMGPGRDWLRMYGKKYREEKTPRRGTDEVREQLMFVGG